MKTLRKLTMLFALVGLLSFGDEVKLPEGMVVRHDLAARKFDLVVPLAYDPKTMASSEERSVYWNEDTLFEKVVQLHSSQIKGQVLVRFTVPMPEFQREMKNGRQFQAKRVDIYDGLKVDDQASSPCYLAEFDAWNSGYAMIAGKRVRFWLGEGIFKHVKVAPDKCVPALTRATVSGEEDAGGRVTARLVSLGFLPDPRKIDKPDLPRILVIGDSIACNYDRALAKLLKGKVNYWKLPDSSGDTRRGVNYLDIWLGPMKEKWQKWDMVVINHGLHDLRQSVQPGTKVFQDKHQVNPDEYERNWDNILGRLSKCGCKVVVCTTTPVPNDAYSAAGRRKDEDLLYNKSLGKVLKNYPQVIVCDLNAVVRQSSAFDKWRTGTDVHYTAAESEILAQALAETVLSAFGK